MFRYLESNQYIDAIKADHCKLLSDSDIGKAFIIRDTDKTSQEIDAYLLKMINLPKRVVDDKVNNQSRYLLHLLVQYSAKCYPMLMMSKKVSYSKSQISKATCEEDALKLCLKNLFDLVAEHLPDVKDNIVNEYTDQLKQAFSAPKMLELMDRSLGISMSTLNALRQVQRLQFMDISNRALIIASEYQIKQERKAMDIIIDTLFNYQHETGNASIGAEQALEWFVRIERAYMKDNDIQGREIVACVTGDGIRLDQLNFHMTYIRRRDTQNPHEYLPLACYIGSDTHENSDLYVLPHYLAFEDLCKKPVIIDDEEWTVKLVTPADMKEQHSLGHRGNRHECLFCNDNLGNGDQCKWRPACNHCKEKDPQSIWCRHLEDLHRVKIPTQDKGELITITLYSSLDNMKQSVLKSPICICLL